MDHTWDDPVSVIFSWTEIIYEVKKKEVESRGKEEIIRGLFREEENNHFSTGSPELPYKRPVRLD